jgi:large subunit ribosomal protein L23
MATKKTTTEEVKENKSTLILSPRVTEKASLQSNSNAFTFVVKSSATKLSLRNEIKKTYKVTPLAINITNLPKRNTFIRGKKGVTAGMKKAIVFLKKGDTITLS